MVCLKKLLTVKKFVYKLGGGWALGAVEQN